MKTLAGMTIAAGTLALAGAGLVGTSTASAQIELEPIAVGAAPDAEISFVNTPDEDMNWAEMDSCPPCGMG